MVGHNNNNGDKPANPANPGETAEMPDPFHRGYGQPQGLASATIPGPESWPPLPELPPFAQPPQFPPGIEPIHAPQDFAPPPTARAAAGRLPAEPPLPASPYLNQTPQLPLQSAEVRRPTPPSAPADRAAEQRQRRKLRDHRTVRMMQLFMTLLFIGALGSAGFVMYGRYQIDRPGPLQEPAIFEVERGRMLMQIADDLTKKGIIRDKKIFAMSVLAEKKAKKLKAGRYSIPAQASMQQVLDILVGGKAIYYQVTIPEGLTSEQAVEILRAHPQLVGDIRNIPPEGTLMPDTYQFSEGMNRGDLLEKMRTQRSDFLAAEWEKRQPDLPYKTPEEAVIMASIVEKETGKEDERGKVAGVFVNRLRKGMKLQSDPTIIYGLVGGKGKLGHPLTRSEMNQKNEYNTYQITGLPPTPIANPGRKAIVAVLNPEQTDHLYFVADGTGGHAFAANLKSHKENVTKWRQVEAERRRAEQLREAEAKRIAAAASGQATAAADAAKPVPALAGVNVLDTKPTVKIEARIGDPTPAQDLAAAKTDPAGVTAVQPVLEPASSPVAETPVQPAVPPVADASTARIPTATEMDLAEKVLSVTAWDETIPLPVRKPRSQ